MTRWIPRAFLSATMPDGGAQLRGPALTQDDARGGVAHATALRRERCCTSKRARFRTTRAHRRGCAALGIESLDGRCRVSEPRSPLAECSR